MSKQIKLQTTGTQTATLKMKLSSFVTLQRWLNQLPLQGQLSRKRNQFTTLLAEPAKMVEDERTKTLLKYAKLGEDGKPETYKDENNVERYDLSDEDEKKFNDDLNSFLETSYEIVFNSDRMKLFNEVGSLVETTDYKFSGALAVEYNNWCEAFEA